MDEQVNVGDEEEPSFFFHLPDIRFFFFLYMIKKITSNITVIDAFLSPAFS